MPDSLHLPKPNFRSSPRCDYRPYAGPASEIEPLLKLVQVCAVSAVSYICTPQWRLDRRKGDDIIFFILSGNCHFEIEQNQATVGAGDCVHLRHDVAHKAWAVSQTSLEVISLHYTATILESLMLSELLPLPNFMHPGMESPLLPMLEEACREYALRPLGWEPSLNALALRLLFSLIREHAWDASRLPSPRRLMELQRLQPALKAMREQLHNPVSMSGWARSCDLSLAQFRRDFRNALGLSPIQYMRRIRMEEACRLLQHTDETVEKIASRVGYLDSSFFSRSFRKFIGIPPGQYRSLSSRCPDLTASKREYSRAGA